TARIAPTFGLRSGAHATFGLGCLADWVIGIEYLLKGVPRIVNSRQVHGRKPARALPSSSYDDHVHRITSALFLVQVAVDGEMIGDVILVVEREVKATLLSAVVVVRFFFIRPGADAADDQDRAPVVGHRFERPESD